MSSSRSNCKKSDHLCWSVLYKCFLQYEDKYYTDHCPCNKCIIQINCSTQCEQRDNYFEHILKVQLRVRSSGG